MGRQFLVCFGIILTPSHLVWSSSFFQVQQSTLTSHCISEFFFCCKSTVIQYIHEVIVAENLHHFLTTAEKQRIILHELESIRAMDSELFKLPNIKLYEGEAVCKYLKLSCVTVV